MQRSRILQLSAAASLVAGCAADWGGVEHERPRPQVETTREEFRITWFGIDHQDITEAGLWFLDSDVAEAMGDENEDTDTDDASELASEYHVDNCRIAEAFDSVNARYQTAVAKLDPSDPQLADAITTFGSITHTMQDFYAHSNWVEIRKTQLVDADTFRLPLLAPGSTWKGVKLTTASLPASWTVTLQNTARVPLVHDGASYWYGLITGTFEDNTDPSACHPAASIPHGDALEQGGYGTYLAKDDPDSFHHDEAVDFAIEQTTEEFCRLARLVTLRYGEEGAALLEAAWVVDQDQYEYACGNNQSLVASVLTAAVL